MGLQMIFLGIDDDIVIFLFIEPASQCCCTDLTKYCRDRRTFDAQCRRTKETKDQDGVHDDIDDGTKALCQHGIKRSACRLQDSFKAELQIDRCRQQTADTQIICTQLYDFGIACLGTEEHFTAEDTENRKNNTAQCIQHQTVIGDEVCSFLILFPQRTGDQRIDTYASTCTNSDHQVLGRECQRYRSQCVFAQSCYEHTVNDII